VLSQSPMEHKLCRRPNPTLWLIQPLLTVSGLTSQQRVRDLESRGCQGVQHQEVPARQCIMPCDRRVFVVCCRKLAESGSDGCTLGDACPVRQACVNTTPVCVSLHVIMMTDQSLLTDSVSIFNSSMSLGTP
jgi:hypothetical protein